MSFAGILGEIVRQCGGGIGAALLGNDGIPIEQVIETPMPGPLGDDIATAGVEFCRILEETRKAADALGGGTLEETVVSLSQFTLVFRTVDPETFLVVALRPDGNLGKARYLIRRSLVALQQEL